MGQCSFYVNSSVDQYFHYEDVWMLLVGGCFFVCNLVVDRHSFCVVVS